MRVVLHPDGRLVAVLFWEGQLDDDSGAPSILPLRRVPLLTRVQRAQATVQRTHVIAQSVEFAEVLLVTPSCVQRLGSVSRHLQARDQRRKMGRMASLLRPLFRHGRELEPATADVFYAAVKSYIF